MDKIFGKRYENANWNDFAFSEKEKENLREFVEKKEKFLVISGETMTGKTHLCAATSKFFEDFAIFYESRAFFLMTETSRDAPVFCKNYFADLIDKEVLFIELQSSLPYSELRCSLMFALIDHRYSYMKPTIISLDLSKDQMIQKYGDKIASRIFAKQNYFINLDSN